jgi:hypothetical protein
MRAQAHQHLVVLGAAVTALKRFEVFEPRDPGCARSSRQSNLDLIA